MTSEAAQVIADRIAERILEKRAFYEALERGDWVDLPARSVEHLLFQHGYLFGDREELQAVLHYVVFNDKYGRVMARVNDDATGICVMLDKEDEDGS